MATKKTSKKFCWSYIKRLASLNKFRIYGIQRNTLMNGYYQGSLVEYLLKQTKIVTASAKPIKFFTYRNYMLMVILH
jgi:hypothetical protein